MALSFGPDQWGMGNFGGLANYGLPQVDYGLTPQSTPGVGFKSSSHIASPTVSGGEGDLSLMERLFKGAVGTKDNPGWGGMALGAAQGLGSLFMGMQQYGLAKKTLAENKRQFELNYGAQRSATNAALEDRQRARIASNPGAYQSVGDYMNQYGIK